MSGESLFRAVGLVGDDLVREAAAPVKKRRSRAWIGWTALAACCAIVIYVAAASQLFRAGSSAKSTGAAVASAPAEADATTQTAAAAQTQEEFAAASAASSANAAPEMAGTAGSAAQTGALVWNGARYAPAPDSDPNRPASEGLEALAGEKLGTVESADDAGYVGDEVYAYRGFEASQYVLVVHEGVYSLYKAEP